MLNSDGNLFQGSLSASSISTASTSYPSTSATKIDMESADFCPVSVPFAHNARQPPLGRMPLLAGVQASRHGRPRKLTKKVEQMLNEGASRATGLARGEGPGIPSSRANSITRSRPFQTGIRRRRRRRRVFGEEGMVDEFEETVEDDDDGYSYQDEDDDEAEEEGDGEEEADDNKTWCICKQRSHGKMVACDNKNCQFEWFHYECVGISQEPRGEWYCPTCKMLRSSARPRSSSSDLTQ